MKRSLGRKKKRIVKLSLKGYQSRRRSRAMTTRLPSKSLQKSPAKRKKKVTVIQFSSPLHGRKLYCGGLEYLPSDEYERFGTRRECLDIGIGVGHAIEYNYLRELLLQEGYEIPERKRLSSY
jgi:hypothetical protein